VQLNLDDDTQTGAGLKELTTLIDLVGDFRVHPEAAAIMTLDQSGSVVTHTYGDIASRISILAAELTRRGFSNGAMILLWAPNSVEWVVAYFAIIVLCFYDHSAHADARGVGCLCERPPLPAGSGW
jgi:long-subunit acyl-CoA synthetase (AMP-forming)